MTAEITGIGSDYVSGDYLAAIRDFALNKNIDIQLLIKDSGLTLQEFLQPSKQIGVVSFCRVGVHMFDQVDDPFAAAIELGQSFIIATHGNLGLAAQGAATLYEAAELCCQFFQTRSSLAEAEIVREQDHTRLRFYTRDIAGIEPSVMQQFRCHLTLALMVNLHLLTNQLVKTLPSEETTYLHLAFTEPEAFPYHLLDDQCELIFDQEHYELGTHSVWEQWQLNDANQALAEIARKQCEAELQAKQFVAFDNQVKQRLRDNLAKNPTIEQMADSLHMSASTLQRKLKSYGTSYQTLKTEVRVEKAKQLLSESSQSIDAIAEALGYSDLSNFSKSFKANAGCTPAVFRQSARETLSNTADTNSPKS